MTSTTGTAGHPDVSELSDLAEGLLSPTRTAAVRGHLAACAECAEVQASLTEIRELLGSLPRETRMPDDVAERLDAALAAESRLDVSRETSSPVSRETSADGPGGATDGSQVGVPPAPRPPGHPRGATGPGRTGTPRRRRVAVTALGTLAAVAVVGIGTLVFLPDGNGGGAKLPTAEQFSGGDLRARVASLLTSRTGGESPEVGPNSTLGESTTDGPKNAPRVQDVPTVPECVSRGIARDEEPIVAENGTYKGSDAWLVVLPHASEPNRVSAYVVDASCTKQDQSTAKGKVLLETSYPRN